MSLRGSPDLSTDQIPLPTTAPGKRRCLNICTELSSGISWEHRGVLQGRTRAICRATDRGGRGERVRSEWRHRAEKEGQTWDVTRHKAVSMAREKRGNEEMEREGAVARDCWARGVCTASLAELSPAGSSNTWSCYSFPKHFYFTSHTTKIKTLKRSHNVFQMLFLTCSLCAKANQCPAFSSANQNWKTQLRGMVLQRLSLMAEDT